MKKAIVVFMVLLTLGTAAFAGGFSVRGGFVYDFVNLKSAESADENPERQDSAKWRANSFGAEFGITYDFSDKFQIYADSSIGFFNKFMIGDTEIKRGDKDNMTFLSTSDHVGIAFNIELADSLDLHVGGGLAFESARIAASKTVGDTTERMETGIFALGVGLYGDLDYKISDRFAICATVHPDLMFLSGDNIETTTSQVHDKTVESVIYSWTTFGGVVSFKFTASVGAKFMF